VEVVEGIATGDVLLIDAADGKVARIEPTVVDVLAQRASHPAGAKPAALKPVAPPATTSSGRTAQRTGSIATVAE
jgi:uncharacterized protein YwbE